MNSKKIRQTFLNFFKKNDHKIIASNSIISNNDSSLMFVNSGMNAFKDIFTGNEIPIYSKIVNTQKCLRITGKHNDLDDVGHDNYHHTMFEMLGNWSFGDYFKEKAIFLAWTLLTKIFNISKNDLYVTVFNGDNNNLKRDNETYEIWKNIINKNNIIFYGKDYNFWEMGKIGPCGPCSEIHIDLRDNNEKNKIPGYKLINKNHPDVIEIWNIVFIQFLRTNNGILLDLPMKHIDTGMGLERLCRVLQNKNSNYDTDLFQPLIKKVELYTKLNYGNNYKVDIAIRVIVDHIRSIVFTLSDGQTISNNGAGYVIKRILRRAISYYYRFLNQKKPLIYKLVDTLVKIMGEIFPEIVKRKEIVKNIIIEEEKKFLKNIFYGINNISNTISFLKEKKIKLISGNHLYNLYDTYGFPLDIIKIIAKENKISIDEDGFNKEMIKQKNRSKKNSYLEKKDWNIINNNYLYNNDLNKIDNNTTIKGFIGYKNMICNITIIRYREVKTLKDSYYELVFDKTPFFPESAGQLGDIGFIYSSEYKIEILNTIKENNTIYHITKKLPKYLNQKFNVSVNELRRKQIEKNHTCIHLLSFSLRKILGNHIEQRGSFISTDKIRFDFFHTKKINNIELQKIEYNVNQMIFEKISIEEKIYSLKKAIEYGAILIPGENYKEKVRTIKFGNSFELCSGTHTDNTINIQIFKIKSISSISSGILRIEGLTSIQCINYINNIYIKYKEIIHLLKTDNPFKYINNLKEKNKNLKIEIDKNNRKNIEIIKKKLENKIEKKFKISYIKYIFKEDIEILKKVSKEMHKNIDKLLLIIGSINNNNNYLLISISDYIINNYKIEAYNILNNIINNYKYIMTDFNQNKLYGKNNFAVYMNKNINKNFIIKIINDLEKFLFKFFNK